MGKTDKPIVAIDLGGTKILAGVIGSDHRIIALDKRATKAETGPAKVIDRIIKTARGAVKAAGLEMADIAAVSVGSPGPLDPVEGVILRTPNLPGWENVPLAAKLSKRLDLPAFVENDVTLGTLGEHAAGAGVGAEDIIGIFVGTGIGGGLVLDGKLRGGWRNAAAEIGHMIVLADGPVCGCGNRGCAEALASRTAIERDIWSGISAGRESLIPKLMRKSGRDRLTSGVLAEAFEAGDTLVQDVMGRAQFYLGLLVASAVNMIDAEIVVFGGGVAEAMDDHFLDPIRRVAYQNFINKRQARDVRIVAAKLGDHAALIGAAVLARQRLRAK